MKMTPELKEQLDEILAELDRDDVSLVMQGYLKMLKGMIRCVAHCVGYLDEYLVGELCGERAEELIRGQIACVTVTD